MHYFSGKGCSESLESMHYCIGILTKSITAKQTKNFYIKYLIANSDLILVNLNNTENSVGTGQELQYAVDKGIPVIGFGKQNVYEWLPEDCDVVFDTLEEAVDYIINYYD